MTKGLLSHPWTARAAPPLLAILLSFAVGMIFIAAIGQSPFEVAHKTFSAFTQNSRAVVTNLGYILAETTPLIFAGLSVALAFHAGLVNIGAQGQIVVGCFLCAWVGFTFSAPGGGDPAKLTSAWIMMPACILAAMIGGGLWGAVPGLLKAYRGSHEVIITIMMNFIAVAVCQYLLNEHFKDPARTLPQTLQIAETARFSRMSVILKDWFGYEFPPSIYLGSSLFFAFGACVAVWLLLWRTRFGYELRAVGQNPLAAEYGGIHVPWNIVLAMTLAGALAGMVALDFVMGYKYLYHQDDAVGYGLKGFLGLAVAILGHNHPVGVILAALLFGSLSRIGFVMSMNTDVPKDLILVLQGVIILFLIVANEWFRRLLLRAKAPAPIAKPAAREA